MPTSTRSTCPATRLDEATAHRTQGTLARYGLAVPDAMKPLPNRLLSSIALVVILSAVFLPMSIVRLVDADEGAYLIAAKLVMQGKLLYHDFSFPQMPLLPYLYGVWMKAVGTSWYAARLLSALFSIALGIALYRQVARITGQETLAFLATVAFAFTGLILGWYPLVKTYAFATLMLFLAYAILDAPVRWKYFVSGLCLGLAVDTRFYLLVVVFTLAVEVVRREPGRAAVRQLGWLVAGLAGALGPNLVLFLASPDAFIFNVLGHHAIRTAESGAIGDFAQKLYAVQVMLGLAGNEGATSLQFGMLLLLNLGLVVSRVRRRRPLPPSVSIAALLLLVSLLPTPVYVQYACIPVPFMIVNAALLVADLIGKPGAETITGRRLKGVLALLLAVYVAVSAAEVHRDVIGRDTPLLRADDWRIPTINRVARAIDREITAANPLVITWWPGYLIESKAKILPGTENHFNLWYSIHLTPDETGRYKYISSEELAWHIMHHTANVVVLGNWLWDLKPRYRQILVDSSYVMIDKIGEAEIYRWNRAPR